MTPSKLGPLLFEHTPCFVAVLDAAHEIVENNPAFVERFGDGRGKPCYAVYKREAAVCADCPAARARERGTEQTASVTGVTRHDAYVAYDLWAVPIAETDQVLLIGADQTRVEELEAGLDQAERLARVGLTAAGLAHSIKNILAGLEGATYAMETGFAQKNEDRQKAGWEMMQEYLGQIEGQVKNLLRYAKPKEPKPERVDVAEAVGKVVGLYENKAALVHTELRADIAPDVPEVWADPAALDDALGNLVTNGIDACQWDPDTDKAHEIVIAAKSLGDTVRILVQDNGMGISEENQRKILRASFTTKGIRGTGLGLLLTKKAIAEQGGALSFTSSPGEGTTFEIGLPRKAARDQKGKRDG